MNERIFQTANGKVTIRLESTRLTVAFVPHGFPPESCPSVAVTIREDRYACEVALAVITGSTKPAYLSDLLDGGFRGLCPDAIVNALNSVHA